MLTRPVACVETAFPLLVLVKVKDAQTHPRRGRHGLGLRLLWVGSRSCLNCGLSSALPLGSSLPPEHLPPPGDA